MAGTNYQIVIIGGGAAGMIAALAASRTIAGSEILIIEKNDRLGKKLLATGNGRCNLSNAFCNWQGYGGVNSDFTKDALTEMSPKATLNFFEEIGLMTREEEDGRIYPYSGHGASVRDAMDAGLISAHVERAVGKTVFLLEKGPEGFFIKTSEGDLYHGKHVILATGGKAGSQHGSTGDGYGFAKSFGHTLVRPLPALVQLRTEDPAFRNLKGVRAKGAVSLEMKGKIVAREKGEIQFTDEGLSGICIFDLSRYYDPNQGDTFVLVDLFPEYTQEALARILENRETAMKNRPDLTILDGMVHPKLASVRLLNGKKAPPNLAQALKNWKVKVSGTRGWADAQVTAGGVSCSEIESFTMESKLVQGLYFAGEVMDVDGRCGGWNLQWAWSSGYLAGQSAAEDMILLEEDSDGKRIHSGLHR
jgi:predicted Rossmann fold flavoprotein